MDLSDDDRLDLTENLNTLQTSFASVLQNKTPSAETVNFWN